MSTRRFWQIHLSTAVVLMVVASGLVFLNIGPRWLPPDSKNLHYETLQLSPEAALEIGQKELVLGTEYHSARGWPALAIMNWRRGHVSDSDWNILGVAINSVVALITLIIVSVICELLIRRREARKP
jgi:hypothetical protein